jgi:hypothetical protein
MTMPREFIISYLTTIHNQPFELNDKCFGDNFDEQLQNIQKYLSSYDYTMILINLQRMVADVHLYCPISSFRQIVYKFIEKYEDKSIYNNLLSNLLKTVELIVNEYKDGEHTARSIGVTLGEITLLYIDDDRNRFFLRKDIGLENNNDNINNIIPFIIGVNEFIEGTIIGLQENSSVHGLCYNDYEMNNDIIITALTTFIIDIQNSKCIYESFMSLIKKLHELKNINETCRLTELYNIIISLYTIEGFTTLIHKIIEHHGTIYTTLTSIIHDLTSKQFTTAGTAFGKLLTILFSFHVH